MPAREHQGRRRTGMPAEDREHPALVFRAEVKEAIPRQNAAKVSIQRQRTHVRDDPVLVGKTALADTDESWRRVNASQIKALLDKVTRDWLRRAASQVEDRGSRRQQCQEAVEPGFLKKATSS